MAIRESLIDEEDPEPLSTTDPPTMEVDEETDPDQSFPSHKLRSTGSRSGSCLGMDVGGVGRTCHGNASTGSLGNGWLSIG